MSEYTVGCVPYVNAVPLVASFEWQGNESPVRVLFDVPSRLPAMLEDGRAQAILVSSIDALMEPDRKLAAGVCIGSYGPVKSVRLFSKVPFGQIETLALDASSLTSNALARILLKELHGAEPRTMVMGPSLDLMLGEADACVLIGDVGMITSGEGLHVMDLGEAWTELTKLPFVWAAWTGDEGLNIQLAGHLQACLQESLDHKEAVIHFAMDRSGWSEKMTRNYFADVMRYSMDEKALRGLQAYMSLLLDHRLLKEATFPELVGSFTPVGGSLFPLDLRDDLHDGQ